MVDSVCGEARSSAAICTMTSYCSPFCSKRVTCRPPNSVSNVRRDDGHFETQIGHPCPVDVDAKLGHVELEIALHALQARIRADALHHQLDVLLELLVGARMFRITNSTGDDAPRATERAGSPAMRRTPEYAP